MYEQDEHGKNPSASWESLLSFPESDKSVE